MAWLLCRWMVAKRECATDWSFGNAASNYRYRGGGQSWCRVWLFATGKYPYSRRDGHDRLEIESGNRQCRPRQESQTNVCAFEEAESGLIQHRILAQGWPHRTRD